MKTSDDGQGIDIGWMVYAFWNRKLRRARIIHMGRTRAKVLCLDRKKPNTVNLRNIWCNREFALRELKRRHWKP